MFPSTFNVFDQLQSPSLLLHDLMWASSLVFQPILYHIMFNPVLSCLQSSIPFWIQSMFSHAPQLRYVRWPAGLELCLSFSPSPLMLLISPEQGQCDVVIRGKGNGDIVLVGADLASSVLCLMAIQVPHGLLHVSPLTSVIFSSWLRSVPTFAS